VLSASTTLTTHGFLFVLAVNRIACAGRACAGRAPVSSRAPRRVAMPTTWERTHHANPDARQRQHHTPTLRSLEPYYYSAYIADLTGFSGKKCPPHLVHQGLFSPYIIVINFDIEAIPPDFQNGGYMISFVRCSFLSVRQSSHPVQLTCILWRKDAKGKCPFKS
jgi:hypothetical protein